MEEEKQEKCVCNNYCPVCPKKTVARWEKRMMAVGESENFNEPIVSDKYDDEEEPRKTYGRLPCDRAGLQT